VDRTYRNLEFGSVIANLPELLLRHLLSEERVALIIEVSGDRYVQFLAREDQQLVVECISNRYLDDDYRLDLDDEMRLLDAGFNPPGIEAEPHPNWWWQSDDVADIMVACTMGAFALVEVLRVPSTELVTLVERNLAIT